jgi:hypothetical protein
MTGATVPLPDPSEQHPADALLAFIKRRQAIEAERRSSAVAPARACGLRELVGLLSASAQEDGCLFAGHRKLVFKCGAIGAEWYLKIKDGGAPTEAEQGVAGLTVAVFDIDNFKDGIVVHFSSPVGCVATPIMEAAGSGSISDPARRRLDLT